MPRWRCADVFKPRPLPGLMAFLGVVMAYLGVLTAFDAMALFVVFLTVLGRRLESLVRRLLFSWGLHEEAFRRRREEVCGGCKKPPHPQASSGRRALSLPLRQEVDQGGSAGGVRAPQPLHPASDAGFGVVALSAGMGNAFPAGEGEV